MNGARQFFCTLFYILLSVSCTLLYSLDDTFSLNKSAFLLSIEGNFSFNIFALLCYLLKLLFFIVLFSALLRDCFSSLLRDPLFPLYWGILSSLLRDSFLSIEGFFPLYWGILSSLLRDSFLSIEGFFSSLLRDSFLSIEGFFSSLLRDSFPLYWGILFLSVEGFFSSLLRDSFPLCWGILFHSIEGFFSSLLRDSFPLYWGILSSLLRDSFPLYWGILSIKTAIISSFSLVYLGSNRE